MRRRRVCFVTTEYPPHPGGAARSAQRLVQGLADAGFEMTVFSATTAEHPPAVSSHGDGTVVVRWLPPVLAASTRIIRQADSRDAFDIFHGFTLLAAFPCLTVAAAGQRPVVSSIRGVDGLAFDPISTEVLRKSAWVTSVSGDSLVRAAAAVPDVSQRSSVIPNGIEAGPFRPWSLADRRRHVIGTVATFRIKKNIPLLIQAYAALPPALRRQLLLVGDAFDESTHPSAAMRLTLEDLIARLGLDREVAITGMVEHAHVPKYHQRMHIFALSSDHEGMPNSILEAAASGLPIVSTAVDGVKDILTDGVDALLVPPHDVEAFSSALARVLTNDQLAQHLSAGARRVAGRLTPAAEVQRYVALYEALLERQSISRR